MIIHMNTHILINTTTCMISHTTIHMTKAMSMITNISINTVRNTVMIIMNIILKEDDFLEGMIMMRFLQNTTIMMNTQTIGIIGTNNHLRSIITISIIKQKCKTSNISKIKKPIIHQNIKTIKNITSQKENQKGSTISRISPQHQYEKPVEKQTYAINDPTILSQKKTRETTRKDNYPKSEKYP
eukprot:TRINITY_DN23578_c0_g1_i1.p1 TRINITY_DN23578_c0_g1~~TRINITY_DN23578_c0_g1_i1.p1  ORF type:complete len:184 (-),score=16.81 TRINITY_DN23578_c0_g1_i1:47-598(-)